MRNKIRILLSAVALLSGFTVNALFANQASQGYGAAVNPTGSPIGGGDGYLNIVTSGTVPSAPTRDAIQQALDTVGPGGVVFLPGHWKVQIGVAKNEGTLVIPKQVTLASDRGHQGSKGAHLYRTIEGDLIQVIGNDVRITGLRLEGPDTEINCNYCAVGDNNCCYPVSEGNSEEAINADRVNGANYLQADNNEIWGWRHGGIYVLNSSDKAETKFTQAYIHHNYIHHNRQWGLGYGVVLSRADVLIEANLFDYNRHDIAGTGLARTSYEARYNLVLSHAARSTPAPMSIPYTYSFDMHHDSTNGGTHNIAGTRISIHHNTFTYCSNYCVNIGGEPQELVEIYNNLYVQPDNAQSNAFNNTTYQGAKWSVYNNCHLGMNCSTGTPAPDLFNREDITVRSGDGELSLHPLSRDEFYDANGNFAVTSGRPWNLVGHGFHQGYTHLIPGTWTADGASDLIVRDGTGGLFLYPYCRSEDSFYGCGGSQVGTGWHYSHYWAGKWTGNGTDDLLIRDNGGSLHLYVWNGSSFSLYPHSPIGNGWNYTHYWPGKWTNNGTDDLLVRDAAGILHLYSWNNGSYFSFVGQVGWGWNYTDYLVGNWSGNGTPDLIARTAAGDLHYYVWNAGFTYMGTVGHGFNADEYLVGNWAKNTTDDLITRSASGELVLYPFNGTFYGQTQAALGYSLGVMQYLPGDWD